MSQEQLAMLLGVDQSAVSNYEQGKRYPSYGILEQLASIFGVSTDYLLGRTDDPTPPGGKERKETKEEKRLRSLISDPTFTDLLMKIPGDLTEEEKESLAESWEFALRLIKERRKKRRREEKKK